MKSQVTVIIPKMVYGRQMKAFPLPVAEAMERVIDAAEVHLEQPAGESARRLVDALTDYHEAWEEHGG